MVIFLKVKLTEFTGKLDVEKHKKGYGNIDPEFWGLGTWKNGVVLNRDEKACEETITRKLWLFSL